MSTNNSVSCMSRGDKDKATGYFRKAYKLLSTDKWLMAHESKRMARMQELGSASQ